VSRDGTTPRSPRVGRLYVFGWPSDLGGADTRLAHTLPLWAEQMAVTVIPNDPRQLEERGWIDYLASIGAHAARLIDLPKKLDGSAIALCNPCFFTDRIAHRAKDRGLHVVWSSEMMWHHRGELAAVRDGVVDCVLFTSEQNRRALEPGYDRARPSIRRLVVENYVDPERFPYRERPVGDTFTVGRLSRPDPLKYPEDFPLFYEMLGLRTPRYRVMAWDSALARKYRWYPFGPAWTLLGAGAETALAFLHQLDAFVYPLGHDFRESWGRSAVEAMLTGLPIVVPRGHHFDSYLRHGETGFLCDGHAAFKDACRALEIEPELRRRIGAAARRFVVEELSDRQAHLAAWRAVFDG
jgi:glycosyltransferase involved in cell wall biosynthesis